MLQSIQTVWLWMNELAFLVSGRDMQYYDKQGSGPSGPSATPRVGRLKGGGPNLQLVVYRAALETLGGFVKAVVESIDFQSMGKNESQLEYMGKTLNLLASLLLRPVLPKSKCYCKDAVLRLEW